ncbi:hypothetical protein WJX73_008370 [Symbiochloris irregularis]|uniref:Uncharacterized protein n=1 Tax=Symbiochloris irregularis TaxID=706552 RepID=A0AAW1PMP9_9CHLO
MSEGRSARDRRPPAKLRDTSTESDEKPKRRKLNAIKQQSEPAPRLLHSARRKNTVGDDDKQEQAWKAAKQVLELCSDNHWNLFEAGQGHDVLQEWEGKLISGAWTQYDRAPPLKQIPVKRGRLDMKAVQAGKSHIKRGEEFARCSFKDSATTKIWASMSQLEEDNGFPESDAEGFPASPG